MAGSVSSASAWLQMLDLSSNWSTLALVLFLISRLLRSWICKYVSFKAGMKDEQHEVVGGGGVGEEEDAYPERVLPW